METDVLILGCGISGGVAALRLAEDTQRKVTVVTRADDPEESNSSYAQGGIVAQGHDDTVELLTEDVIRAGAGLAYPAAVRLLAEQGPPLLEQILIDVAGVEFDRGKDGRFVYGLEGAHSRRRILHVGDTTGRAIMRALIDRLRQTPNIELLCGHTAVDLLTYPHHSRTLHAVYRPPTCHGAYVLDCEARRVEPITARQTILATGGLGQIYLNTTNPEGARGDGLAMAYRAGARVINTEYVQFHPTALHMPGTTKMLISEAVRGEGALLTSPDGKSFLERYAPKERELASRDVVSRAIYTEMLANHYPYVHLDVSHLDAGFVEHRFPQIHAHCLTQNIDITRQPIPVVPAAHYSCGGVLVDLDGRTTLPGLYAIGEVSCTGIHGANRLASTSLLEGLVWGSRAADDIRALGDTVRVAQDDVPPWDESGLSYEADPALVQGDMQTIRNLMWHYVGLLRNELRLARAANELRRLWPSIEDFYNKAYLTDELIGLRNAIVNAVVVTRAAIQNPTSRGCHYREDSRPGGGAVPPNDTNQDLLESKLES